MDAAELVIRITGDIDDIERKLDSASRSASSFGDKMESAGRKMSGAGRDMTAGLTVPMVALGGFALKTAIDFESAFAGVRKTIDGTDADFAQLEQGIRNMAKSLPASAVEIAGVAEAAGQLGIAKENILSFSRTMIDLGETTNLTADEAANALARIANITKMPQDQFDRLGATIVALGNAGASTESEITAMALRIAGAGTQAGLTQADILAVASALSSLGIEAEAGGSAISTVFIKMSKAVADGGRGLADFAEVAGVSSEKFASVFKSNATGALDMVAKGLGRVGQEGGNVFKVMEDLGFAEIRQRDAMLRLAGSGDILSDSLEVAGFAWANNTALTDEAGKRYATTAAKLEMLWNKVKDAAMVLGAELVPALMSAISAAEPLGRFLVSAVQWFSSLPDPVQTFIIALAGIVAIAGPILVAVGTVVTAISAIAPVVAAVAGVILGPVGLIIAAIVAIGAAAFLLWQNWDTVWGAITGGFGAVAGFISDHFLLIIAPIAPMVAALLWLWDNWQNILSLITGAIGSAAGAVNDRLSEIVGWFGELPHLILSALGDLPGMLWDSGWGMMEAFADGIRAGLGRVLSAVRSVLSKARDLLPFSDAKTGPLADLTLSGQRLAETFAKGIGSSSAISDALSGTLASPSAIAPMGGASSDAIASAVASAVAAALAPLIAQMRQGGMTNVFPAGTDPMHMAREIAWRTGG